MGLLDVFRRGDTRLTESQQTLQELEELSVERSQLTGSLDLLQERIAELEFALEDQGYVRLSTEGHREFSRAGLGRLIDLSRMMYLKNPLIQQGVNVQANYVFALGVNIKARDARINDVLQAFIDDRRNQKEFTSRKARKAKEIELATAGNLFFVFFPNASTGHVRVGSIPVEEVPDIITDPEDRKTPWYYKRVWQAQVLDASTGTLTPKPMVVYYPDWQYRPAERPPTIGDAPVRWDTPVYHVRVGGFDNWTFGLPETYAALDWARAAKEDLEDYATVKKALAAFAWSLKTAGGAKGISAAKTKLASTLGSDGTISMDTNPPPVRASTFISAPGVDMQPVKTAGAQPSPEEGRRLWMMTAAALGIPETFFDPKQGNLATAKTLDRPTELKMIDRQGLWQEIHLAILTYVVDQAALATSGPLPGKRAEDPNGGEIVVLGNDPDTGEEIDRHIDVDFPDILERDVVERIGAIVQAATLGGFPAVGTLDTRTLVSLLLEALGLDDIDELLEKIAPEDGESLMDKKEQQKAELGDSLLQGFDKGPVAGPPAGSDAGAGGVRGGAGKRPRARG